MRKVDTESDVLQRHPDLEALAQSLQPLCTVDEAARALRLSPKSIRNYISSGVLQAARGRDGSRVLITRAELLRHVALRLSA